MKMKFSNNNEFNIKKSEIEKNLKYGFKLYK